MNTTDRVNEIIRDFCGSNRVDATDVLAAASVLDEEFVIIPRSDLPDFKVIDGGDGPHVDCGSDWGTWNVKHVAAMKKTALEYVGAWLTAEKWRAEQGMALTVRRDELAREVTKDGTYAYRFAEEPLQLAIDRIIELEQAAS